MTQARRKVFVIGRPHPDSFVRNVAVTLERMGCAALTLPPPRKPAAWTSRTISRVPAWGEEILRRVPAWAAVLRGRLLRMAREFKPDLILTLTREADPETLDALARASKAKVAHWHADPIPNLGREELVSFPYDAVFLKDREMVGRLNALFAGRFHHLPEAMNPAWHKPAEPSPRYRCQIGVAGNLYPYRCRILEQLMEYEIKLWGPAPPAWLRSPALRFYTGEYVAEATKSLAFSSAAVCLNTLSLREGDSANCRMFEIAGCGGFQVMEHRPAAAEFLEPGKEVLFFRDTAELKAHVERGLKDLEFNRSLRAAAAHRAAAEHTYERRLQALLGTLWP